MFGKVLKKLFGDNPRPQPGRTPTRIPINYRPRVEDEGLVQGPQGLVPMNADVAHFRQFGPLQAAPDSGAGFQPAAYNGGGWPNANLQGVQMNDGDNPQGRAMGYNLYQPQLTSDYIRRLLGR